MSSSGSKVLIIGAGPGGLVLAHALQKNRIPYEIFERDAADHVRPQGWAVALHEYVFIASYSPVSSDFVHSALPALKATIPDVVEDINLISVNANLGVLDWIGVVDNAGNLLSRAGGVPEGQPGNILRVRRERLRDYLWQGLPVQGGKYFTHYIEDDNGVTAYFADGISARGSILVGADGAHSHVRKQLLGLEASPAPYIPILGSAQYPRDIFEPIHNLGTAAVACGAEGIRAIISMLSVEADRSSAHYYWGALFRSDHPEQDGAWAAAASKEELHAKATQLAAALPEFFQRMVQHTGAEGIMKPPLRFVEFSPPSKFSMCRVTILGDAAHSSK